MENIEELKEELAIALSSVDLDEGTKVAVLKSIILKVNDAISHSSLKEKLGIMYDYEKQYLALLKEYKEEIKFVVNLQEELRKERTKFFSESLKEVAEALKEAQVDNDVASLWIKELVKSYTSSLDISSNLMDENVTGIFAELKKMEKSELNKLVESEQKNSTTP